MKYHKVLLISSNSSGRGGGERYLVFLSQGLLSLGIKVHVLLSTLSYMDEWAETLKAVGVTIHRLPLKGLAQRKLRFLSAILDLAQIKSVNHFCRTLSPDAILINQQYDEDGIDYIAGALKSECQNVVGIMHMPMTAGKNMRPFGWWRGMILRWWYFMHPYRLILVSKGAQFEFESYYPNPRPTYIVNNAIPLENSVNSPLESIDTANPHIPVLGFVGQIVVQKNLGRLIEAWHMLRNRGIETKLLIVGDGPERSNIERQLLAANRIDNWSITGWITEPEAKLQEMDIFVMSSNFEGLPLSLLEAAARGITCVVTPFNGSTDVAKHAPWVHVTEEFSADSIRITLEKILRNWKDQPTIDVTQLQSFRNYFSPNRMAKEVAKIMKI